ncbi:hypothetical protein [Streptomyces hokutonensis]|uniref:hypothetical protein n=1 Tax=Streptomyces hokutonensis TaxID=1306990 RepID=UPI00036746A0|nr:hypothetical protein [Streptomyces hokutonensis]
MSALSLSPDELMGLLAGAHIEDIRAQLPELGTPEALDGHGWQHEADLGTVRLRLRVEFTSTGMTLEQAEAWIVAGDPGESRAERQAARALLQSAGLPVPDTGEEDGR